MGAELMVRPSDRLAPCRHFLRLFIGSIAAWITPLAAQSYQWENLAGLGGGPGHEDGPVATAKIFSPSSTVADSQGNIFFIESFSRTVRKISTSGFVSTLAGNLHLETPQDGAGRSASFHQPKALVIDSEDNLFVADGRTIRKVTPAGVVTTLAGKHAATPAHVDGSGAGARFISAETLVIDSQNQLYAAGKSDYSIRKITPSGVVTTLAGRHDLNGSVDGKGAAARFGDINALAITPTNHLYVRESGSFRKVSPDGAVTTVTVINNPYAYAFLFNMTFDASGNMYFRWGDSTPRIDKHSTSGVSTPYAGGFIYGHLDGPADQARFSSISGLFMDKNGRMLVTELDSIRSISSEGQVTTIVWTVSNSGKTDGTGSQARFTRPSLIFCSPEGNLVTKENSNGKLRQTTPAGVVTTLVGGWALGETFSYSYTFANDLKTDGLGHLFVAEAFGNDQVRKIGPDGSTLLSITQSSDGRSFDNPKAVALDSQGNLFVADSWNNRICKIAPNGTCTAFAGAFKKHDHIDGPGASARFGFLEAMVTDSHDNLYVADSAGTIRKITPQGRVSTLVGKPHEEGHVDGPKAVARIHTPYHMAIDASDHLYIIDRPMSTVRKVAPDGSVRTIGGTPGTFSCADGPGPLAQFCLPEGIAVGANGTVYVTDTVNNRIVSGRVIKADMAVTGNESPVSGGASKPSPLNQTSLGVTKAEEGSLTRTFEIHSLGQEALHLTGTPRIRIQGRHAADFSVTTEPDPHIPAGESSPMQITFSPSASGLRQAEVVIESTDEQQHSFTFAIEGMGDSAPPALTLSKPAAGELRGLSPITVSGTVSDDIAVERVEITLDGGTPVLADLSSSLATSRTRTFQASLSPGEGTHTLQATVLDSSGHSRSVSRVFSFVRQWRLELHRQVPPALAARPELAGSLMLKADVRRSTPLDKGELQTASVQPGTEVQVSAMAKTGYLFDHWGGLPEGAQADGNVLRWIMPAADVEDVTATFIANPFLVSASTPLFPGAGSTVILTGLVEPVSPTVWSNANVGQLTAALTRATGAITGTLRMDGRTHPFNAQCFGDGSIGFRGTTGRLSRTWVFGLRSLGLSWSPQGLALTVSGPTDSLCAGLAVPVISTPPSLLRPKGQPALYTLIFPAQPQTPELPASRHPQGTGYAGGTLSAQGSWPLAIVLADGTKATASPMLAGGNLTALFVPLTTPGTRQSGGSFLGTLAFDVTQTESDVSSTNMHWFRQAVLETADTATHPYSDGWPQGLEVTALGARYDASLSIQQGLQLPDPDGIHGNVSLVISEGGLPSAPEWDRFGISGNRILPTPALPKGLTLTFMPGQGLFKGRFPPTWSSPAKTLPEFQGLLIQKGTHRGGHGFFLSNRQADMDPLSGRVLVQP